MFRIIKINCIIGFWTLICGGGLAQDLELNEISISANKSPTQINSTGANITIIDQNEIANAPDFFLTDLLKAQPGLSITQNGPIGSTTELYMRGFNSKYIKVLLDGVDIADVTGVEVKPSITGRNLSDVKTIEILQGSQSALYGSEAVGGVISVNTFDLGADDKKNKISVEAGTYSTRAISLSSQRSIDDNKVGIRYSNFSTEGFSALGKDSPGAEADGYSSRDISVKSESRLSDQSVLSLGIITTNEKGDYDGFNTDETGPYFVRKTTSIKSSLKVDTATLEHQASLSYFNTDRTAHSTFSTTPYKGNRMGVNYQVNGNRSIGRLIGGVSANFDTFKIAGEDRRVSTYAGFMSILTNPTLNSSLDATVRIDQHSLFGSKITGRANATFEPTSSLTLKIGAGTGFRAPSLDELYGQYTSNDPSYVGADANGDIITIYGNTKLKPETSTNLDAGFSYLFSSSGARLEGSLFDLSIENSIIYDNGVPEDWYDGGYLSGQGKEQRKGYSFSLDYPILSKTALGVSYAYNVDGDGKYIRRVPIHEYGFSIDSELSSKTHIYLNMRAVQDISDVDDLTYTGLQKMPDYNLLNGKLTFTVSDSVKIYLRGENLLDENYNTVFGHGTSSRAFYFGSSSTF